MIQRREWTINQTSIAREFLKLLENGVNENTPDEAVQLYMKLLVECQTDAERYQLTRFVLAISGASVELVEVLIKNHCKGGLRGKIRGLLLYLFFSL